MSHSKLRSIKCTHCGAPLTLHGGGHKIRSINCSFCGSVLDAREHFKVLHRFSHQEKPYSPFELGMQGEIKGMTFTIIGMLAWQDVEYYQWVDLMLFSPTRGYAWLTYYDGHLVFMHRTREIPDLNVWNLAPKYTFTAGGRQYKFFERYRATITYVAGELTWIARKNDQVHLIEAINPPFTYTVEHNGREIEYGIGEYLEDQEAIYQSFGVSDQPPPPRSIHPAQPYRSRFFVPLSKAARPFIAVAAVLAVVTLLFFSGREIYSEQLSADQLKQGIATREFTVTQSHRLLKLDLETHLTNAWTFYEIVVRQGAKPVFSLGKGVSFYEGRDSEGYWSEGSRSASARFKVPKTGDYTLHIQAVEGGTGEYGNTMPASPLRISLKQGYVSPYYFVLLLIATVVAACTGFISRRFFEAKRWKPVLGEDAE